ncbi:MAG: glycogen synthase [Actinomycetota bacterium]|nr:glycogen synthase [Actinomycetota bacterium]
MRVALLTREFPPEVYGGAGVHVGELADALAGRVEVAVHCFGGPRPSPLVAGNYEPWGEISARAGTDPLGSALEVMAVDLAMVAGIGAVDVAHSHTWYANLAGHLAKVARGVSHVATVHSLEPLRPWKAEQLGGGYQLSRWCEQIALEHADAVIAVSQAMADDLLACYPKVAPERVEVIHNGVDARRWQPNRGSDVLERYGVDASRPLVTFVGRITRQKGLAYLLDAAPLIDPAAQLVLCTGAADTAALAAETKRRIAELDGRPGGVVWIQAMLSPEEVAQLHSRAAAFVCPSIYEPFGLVNVEAMACGAPVVASAIGGIPEIVLDGETGLLVELSLREDGQPTDPVGFAAALAEAINALVRDPARVAAMGRAARRRVEEHFSWSAVADKTVALYERVNAGRTRGSLVRPDAEP